jgi:hypothetical protein
MPSEQVKILPHATKKEEEENEKTLVAVYFYNFVDI